MHRLMNLVLGLALLSTLSLFGCDEGECVRNSNCDEGYQCSAGTCELIPVDASVADADAAAADDAAAEAGAGDATIDASTPDAEVDATVADADTDA